MTATITRLTAARVYALQDATIPIYPDQEGAVDYHAEKGERPATWIGSGLASLTGPVEGLAPGHLTAVFELDRCPDRAVVGYEITFVPARSVSALWAIGGEKMGDQVQAANDAAIQDMVRLIEMYALYARRGTNGVRQVNVTGAIAAAFPHRTDRHGNPSLHTHLAVGRRVQDPHDGAWLTIDPEPLLGWSQALGESYDLALAARLGPLGVSFEMRETAGLRTFEIQGVPNELMSAWSSSVELEVNCW